MKFNYERGLLITRQVSLYNRDTYEKLNNKNIFKFSSDKQAKLDVRV